MAPHRRPVPQAGARPPVLSKASDGSPRSSPAAAASGNRRWAPAFAGATKGDELVFGSDPNRLYDPCKFPCVPASRIPEMYQKLPAFPRMPSGDERAKGQDPGACAAMDEAGDRSPGLAAPVERRQAKPARRHLIQRHRLQTHGKIAPQFVAPAPQAGVSCRIAPAARGPGSGGDATVGVAPPSVPINTNWYNLQIGCRR